MARNRRHAEGNQLSVAATDPASPTSGDPVLHGQVPGVALTDERADGTTTVQFNGVFELAVGGEGFDGVSPVDEAVAVGDILYYNAAVTPVLNKDERGTRYGYALGTVTGGGSATIPVKVGY